MGVVKGSLTSVCKGSLTSVSKKWSFLARQAKSRHAMGLSRARHGGLSSHAVGLCKASLTSVCKKWSFLARQA